jgi:hypothetical protein
MNKDTRCQVIHYSPCSARTHTHTRRYRSCISKELHLRVKQKMGPDPCRKLHYSAVSETGHTQAVTLHRTSGVRVRKSDEKYRAVVAAALWGDEEGDAL